MNNQYPIINKRNNKIRNEKWKNIGLRPANFRLQTSVFRLLTFFKL